MTEKLKHYLVFYMELFKNKKENKKQILILKSHLKKLIINKILNNQISQVGKRKIQNKMILILQIRLMDTVLNRLNNH